jgi:hypothetical protein
MTSDIAHGGPGVDYAMNIDFSPIRLLLVLGLLAGAVCFGFCLRAVTSSVRLPMAVPANRPPPQVVPAHRPPPPGVPAQEPPSPVQDAQQWRPPAPQYVPTAAAAPATSAPAPRIDADRGRDRLMIGELIGAYDTFETEGVRIYLAQALKRAGVTKLEPAAGTRFDADLHKSFATVAAQSLDQHMLIAGTNKPGWRDDDGVELRQPEVTVYKWEASR